MGLSTTAALDSGFDAKFYCDTDFSFHFLAAHAYGSPLTRPLPAPPRVDGTGHRPVDDSCRLAHDEAQRRRRDGTQHCLTASIHPRPGPNRPRAEGHSSLVEGFSLIYGHQ